MEEFSPGNKKILLNSCTSVQTQERHPTRTAVGMRSEKTSNHEAKTPGGITNFSTKHQCINGVWAGIQYIITFQGMILQENL